MKQAPKLIFILFFFLFATTVLAQSNNPEPDDSFNLFLLTMLTVFVCAMIGAAIIGAIVASLILFFLFAVMSLGVLSTSVAIGLYKRSFTAGFRSFLMILLGSSSSIIGGIGLFLVSHILNLPATTFTIVLIGAVAGFIGGMLMTIATEKIFRWFFKTISQKLQLI